MKHWKSRSLNNARAVRGLGKVADLGSKPQRITRVEWFAGIFASAENPVGKLTPF